MGVESQKPSKETVSKRQEQSAPRGQVSPVDAKTVKHTKWIEKTILGSEQNRISLV